MKIHRAFNGVGPKGEPAEEILSIILKLMEPYNMHHVPSEEMPELEINKFFLAEVDNKYVGASGYKMVGPTAGKTTLLAVDALYARRGIGSALQKIRVAKMKQLGATSIITNSDRPATIAWYKKQGYQEVGKIPKAHSFGWEGADSWTTLELKLD